MVQVDESCLCTGRHHQAPDTSRWKSCLKNGCRQLFDLTLLPNAAVVFCFQLFLGTPSIPFSVLLSLHPNKCRLRPCWCILKDSTRTVKLCKYFRKKPVALVNASCSHLWGLPTLLELPRNKTIKESVLHSVLHFVSLRMHREGIDRPPKALIRKMTFHLWAVTYLPRSSGIDGGLSHTLVLPGSLRCLLFWKRALHLLCGCRGVVLWSHRDHFWCHADWLGHTRQQISQSCEYPSKRCKWGQQHFFGEWGGGHEFSR